MVKHSLVTVGQLILVTIIILFVLYRVALLMGWVPEGFSPSGLINEEYKSFKENLRQDAYSDDATAPISLFVLESMNKIEAAYIAESKIESEQENIDKRCGENSIYRYFMTMSGSDPEGNCTPEKRRLTPVAPATPLAPVTKPKSTTPTFPVTPAAPMQREQTPGSRENITPATDTLPQN